jgi:hypothetical protein
MKVRAFNSEDYEGVRSLHERSSAFALPNFNHPQYKGLTIVEEDQKIVGFGCLKVTSEGIIIINNESSLKTRAQAVEQLVQTGVFQCQKLGLTEMHAFLTGSNQGELEKLLRRKFGFVGHTGNVLVLEV